MAVTTGKIDRKYMAHFLDAGSLCGGKTPSYERLGKDLEEYKSNLIQIQKQVKILSENLHSNQRI